MWDVKYLGDSLRSLVTEATFEATDRLCRDIASEAREVMDTTARAATPARTGVVRDSWIAEPISHKGDRYETGVYNPHWLAWMLSTGAQPHEIFPERGKALATPYGPRRDVHSPGFRGHRMPERAVETAEATLEPLTLTARERWARAGEFAAERAKARHRIV
jgi:hypothetical protein